jgi:16S rRNA (cytosine1402-N4)-methyltransferase
VSGPPQHAAVLLREAVDALNIKPAGTYVDGTFGRGGHTRAILERLGPEGRLLALDCDPQAVAVACTIVDQRLLVMHHRFGDLADALRRAGVAVEEAVDGVLLDIGVSSPQLDEGEQGLQFPPRRASRHADGYDTRRDSGTVASAGQRAGDHGGH